MEPRYCEICGEYLGMMSFEAYGADPFCGDCAEEYKIVDMDD